MGLREGEGGREREGEILKSRRDLLLTSAGRILQPMRWKGSEIDAEQDDEEPMNDHHSLIPEDTRHVVAAHMSATPITTNRSLSNTESLGAMLEI
eukprot:747895-Hanusia_phi.AAC.7